MASSVVGSVNGLGSAWVYHLGDVAQHVVTITDALTRTISVLGNPMQRIIGVCGRSAAINHLLTLAVRIVLEANIGRRSVAVANRLNLISRVVKHCVGDR